MPRGAGAPARAAAVLAALAALIALIALVMPCAAFASHPRITLAGSGANGMAAAPESAGAARPELALMEPRADTLAWSVGLRRLALDLEERPRVPCPSTLADSCWARVLTLPDIWQWEALRHLANRALARSDSVGAEALLLAADASRWPPAERAARLVAIASVRAARGDTAGALLFCRQILRVYPSLAPAREALALDDRLRLSHGDSLAIEDERLGAEVEFWAGARDSAARRLARIFAPPRFAGTWRAGLRLAEVQRLARRMGDARVTLARTLRLAPDSAARSRIWLERARVLRDAGAPDSAFAAFERAARLTPERGVAETAWWELAREAEEQGAWRRARKGYARVESMGLRHASDASLRLGLGFMRRGGARRARIRFVRGRVEASRFWWALAARDSSRAASDSVLASIARMPGYSFYRTAARETLGLRGWTGDFPARLAVADAALALADSLLRAGSRAECAFLLERWAADDPRAGAPRDSVRRHPWALLAASDLEAAAGSPREAIHLAERAGAAFADSIEAMRWAAVPAIYPAHFTAAIDSALAEMETPIEPAVVHALIWKESHFDSAAVSRSGAIGLTQLMPASAAESARQMGEAPPADSMLTGARTNIRYGIRHLRALIDRFGGRLPLALSAYNAGVTAARRWEDLAHGASDAMLCETIAYPETQDYVKTILAVAQAYRELLPRSAQVLPASSR